MVIYFVDGTNATNSSWQTATFLDTDGHFISILGGGGTPVGLVPTCQVKYITFI